MTPPLETVAGRYRLLNLVGKGGMGSVWRGEHTSLETPVAIKLLDPRLAEREVVRARFLREAKAAASLRSKHVVQIFDHGIEDGTPYIVMELLAGESLGERLSRERRLPAGEVAKIFGQVGAAMARAHKAGVVHRDLKPDNVFLATPEEDHGSGDAWTVKVVDFGVAKLLDDSLTSDVSTETGSMLGTPHYMSPEQARGLKSIDARADLWAMAVIAYECLLGERPFRADTLGELVLRLCADAPPVPSSRGAVPEGFDEWFAKATRKDIEQRFQDVGELVRELCEVLTPGAPTTGIPTPEPSAPGRPSRPNSATSPRATSVELDATVAAEGPGKTQVPEPRTRRPWVAVAAVSLAVAGVTGALALRSTSGESPAGGAQPTTGSALASASGPAPAASGAAGGVASPRILGVQRPSTCKPAAADAYMKGLDRLRLADWDSAVVELRVALAADPDCAPPAVLLMAMEPHAGNTADLAAARALYRRFAPRKLELSADDQALLEGAEAYLLHDPPDSGAMLKRLSAASERAPGNALLAQMAAVAARGDAELTLRLTDRALAAEPSFADTLQTRSRALDALERPDEAREALARCIEISPVSQCVLDHLAALSSAGQCDAMEKGLRSHLLASGGLEAPYELLGQALAARSAPDGTVVEAFRQQATKLGGDTGAQQLVWNEANLDVQRGRFDAAATKARALAEQVESSPAAFPHELAARLQAELLLETEQQAELKKVASAFFDRHPLWTPDPRPDRATPALLFALQELGEISAEEGSRRIDAWYEAARKKTSDRPYAWALRASCATTQDEARRLLSEAPPTPTLRIHGWLVDVMKGRLKLLTGAADESVKHLARATSTCLAPSSPFAYLRAQLWLGEARERTGDKPGACAAYATVQAAWGAVKPLPRTARQAAERATALQCELK